MFYLTSVTEHGEVIQISSAQYEASIGGGLHPNAFQGINSEAPENSYWDFVSEQWVDRGSQPSPLHQFDYSIKQWVDPRSLSTIKSDAWDAMKKQRAVAILAPLTTPYGVFDADAPAQKAITDAVLMLQTLAAAGTPTTIDFTLADNSTVTLTTQEMVNVGLLLGQRTQTVFALARAKRISIEAATTKAEVDAVTW